MTFPDTTFIPGTTITSTWLNAVNDYCNESNPADHSSANVTYDPPFTNSVSTNVENKLSQYVSVEDFGAVGDGIVDDTTAFNNAIAATDGEIVLDPNKTYAVNLVITKRGTRINGRSGDNLSVSGTQIKNLIPFDATSPVIQIGDDANYVGGVVIQNLSIWSQSPSGTQGTIGLYLAGGAYGNYVQNVQIGNSFSEHNLLLKSSSSVACAYNQITNIQLWTLANVNQIATLATYYGDSYTVANYISNFNITGPSGTGTGYAILIDSVDFYMSNGWVQVTNNKGINFQKNWASYPRLYGTNVAVDSDTSTDVLLTNSNVADTASLPISVLFGSITVDGQYKNAAGTVTPLTYGSYIPYESLITYPVMYGYQRAYNISNGTTVQTVSVSGSNNATSYGDLTNTGRLNLLTNRATGIVCTGLVRSDSDNVDSLGTAGQRWSVVYAATGTINTSDENQKTDIRPLDYKEKAVALAIKARIKAFKFKDAVEKKGDDARIHLGVLAQDVQAAFEAEGLDATKYGVFCSDVLKDGTTRLGVRYDELMAFLISVS